MKPSLLVYGLRTAQPRQLRARALRPLHRRRLGAGPPPPFHPLEAPAALWRSPAFESRPLAGAGPERLRGFHAHYGEDVLGAARAGDAPSAARLLTDWIERNPARPSDAWHPYTISTRAGNWIAALSLLPELETSAVRASLWRQLVVLARNVEDDVLGNHVIRNARALVLGGTAFGAREMVERGVELLERELPVQILPDGGHYERSPVYHLVVLRDLLEIEAATDVPGLAAVIERMRGFAAGLARPDGAPALFNDGGLDLAPALELPAADEGLSLFADTGYAVLRTPRVWLAFDCGPPSPPYLPAHAHADALSFQLWVDGRAGRRRSRHVHVRAGRRARLVPRHARPLDRRRRRRPVRALGRLPFRPAAARRAARGVRDRTRRGGHRPRRRPARAPDPAGRRRADDPRPPRRRRDAARRERVAAGAGGRLSRGRDRIEARDAGASTGLGALLRAGRRRRARRPRGTVVAGRARLASAAVLGSRGYPRAMLSRVMRSDRKPLPPTLQARERRPR